MFSEKNLNHTMHPFHVNRNTEDQNLHELGRVLHLSRNKNLITRTITPPQIGMTVVDRKHQKVGTVKDVFGPVKNPYVSVKPDVVKPEEYVGKTIYLNLRSKREDMPLS